ncbi:MAG: hypothetical protein FJ288_12675 [Planctomycetes bacterium]|nr:hypothetical protein [Planctomycetota bacterium]
MRLVLFSLAALLVAAGALDRPSAAEQRAPTVEVFDTGASSPAPLSARAIADKTGWGKLPEGRTAHTFKGDAVLANDRITVVFRRSGPGAELYANAAEGPVLRAVLAPMTDNAAAAGPASVAIAALTAAETAVDAAFKMPGGGEAVVRFTLQPGQVFVRTEPRRGVQRLRLEAPCRLAVLPDFFADDIVVDAAELPVDRAELPGENFLMHMVGRGEAIVLAVWTRRDEDIRVSLAGRDKTRAIQASEIPYAAAGAVSVALLEGPGMWHSRDVSKADADRIIPLEWKAPFAAQWRTDWRQDDGLTDSWEMLIQQPDGSYVKPDWFGQSDSYGTPDWMKPDRKRWTTVLSTFQYPCWIEKDGRGFLQPLKKPGKFQGPALVYPINRVGATPLETFTFTDIVRATLGVGPCEYVLDVEGQKKKAEGIPTCAVRTALNTIYTGRQQKEKKAEVEQALADVLAFIQHIRTRIEGYVTFGRRTLAYLQEQKKARPELAPFLSEMETLTRRIDAAVEKKSDAIQTPQYAAQLVEEFRTTLVGYEGDDAADRCKKITAGFVKIGGAQDDLVGECRVAVKILRQKAALAMLVDPRTAPVANEIRSRTQAMLRSPTSYEAPRH